jgi:hypothetical protein
MQTLSFQRPRGRVQTSLCAALIALALVAVSGAIGTSPAQAAARSVTFAPSFSSDTHLGEGGSFEADLAFSGSEYHGRVAPLTGLTIHLPAGVDLSSAGFPTCSKETIERLGPGGCPAGSLAGPVGSFTALIEFEGLQEEHASLQAIFGPSGALYFFFDGETPVSLELIAEGHLVSDSAPYGQDLVLEVPTIETVDHGLDGSITALDLNFGTTWEVDGSETSSLTLPNTCPGSFTWAVDATFLGEASEPVGPPQNTACPPTGARPTTATTLAISNTAPHEAAPVTYTATVAPTGGGVVPAGNVVFYDGALPIHGCEAQSLTGSASDATAACQVSYSDPRTHEIRAVYSGSETYRGSLSHSQNVVVQSGPEEAPAKETEPAKHEKTPPSSSGTSTGSQPTGDSSGSTGSGSGSGTTVTISSAQIAAMLGQQLVPSGKAAKIGALLKAGGLTMPFKALEAGTAVIDWYEVPVGAKLARRSTAKPVLVALGRVTFLAAGTGKIRVGLTAAGRKMLKHAQRVRLTAKGMFDTYAKETVATTKTFTLLR